MSQRKPVTAKRVSAPAFEVGERPRPYRYWWLAIVFFSLAGWAIVIAAVTLVIALVR